MALSSTIKFPTAAELRQQSLDDLELMAIDAEIEVPPMAPGSDWYIKATVTANRASGVIDALQAYDNDANPFTSAGDALDELLRGDGLPEVPPAPGRGKLLTSVSGNATILQGLKFQAAGMKGTVTRTLTNVTGDVSVDVVMDTTGPNTNLAAGTKVRWINQPANVATEATVISRFVGGVGVESESRKRERLLISRQNPPGGGNWSQKVLTALATSGSIAGAFSYPALGGPSSSKLVLTSNTTSTTREVSQDILDAVALAIAAAFPTEQALTVVQSSLDLLTDIALGLKLPTVGSGIWLAHGPNSPARIASMSTSTSFQIQAVTGTAAGMTVGDKLACWSATDHSFSTATITAVSAVDATTYLVETDLWSGLDPVVGSWVSPACEGIDEIASAWLTEMVKLGPGENVSDSESRFQFAFRHPDATEGAPMELSSLQTGALQAAVTDIIKAEYVYTTDAAPPVPATVEDRPYVLCLRKFGVYPL